MKLTIREDSTNYCCTIVKLPPKQKVEELDRLVKVTIFGNDVLTQKDADENQLYLFFPAECCISDTYLKFNNEYRESTLNIDRSQKGYFEPSGRVKSIKFKGIISTGYLAPISTLYPISHTYWKLKEGDEFTDIDGVNICKKYKVVHQQGSTTKESRYNKKLKRFDKLVPNQFRFHVDTSQLAKNLHMFSPEDIIVITDKWHGTSAVFSNVLINKELTWYEKLLKKFGVDIVTTRYDRLYSSRSVIKNQYINKEQGGGYYGEDIWAVVNKELENKIEIGITLYGEIVGYLPSGRHIQKGYDYGCQIQNVKNYEPTTENPSISTDGLIVKNQHKFLVYRITYTKPDGSVIEFSWQQIKNYCQKYQLEHVKELYFGKLKDYCFFITNDTFTSEEWFKALSVEYLEKDCKYCVNKVPAEGIVVRRDGLETYSAYKLKSRNFLLGESKALDSGEVDLESNS